MEATTVKKAKTKRLSKVAKHNPSVKQKARRICIPGSDVVKKKKRTVPAAI